MADQGGLPILPRYDLDGGVCVSASPVHIQDSQLVSAQNAQFDLQGSLRKRDGLTAFTSALGDTIMGATAVPLPNPDSTLVTDLGVDVSAVGASNADTYLVTTLTRSGGTVTVTVTTTIWFVIGMTITIAGATPSAYNGSWVVDTIPSSISFTFPITGTPTTPATGTITVSHAATGGGTTGAGAVNVPTLMVGHGDWNTAQHWSLSHDGVTWSDWAQSGAPPGFGTIGSYNSPITSLATGSGNAHLWWASWLSTGSATLYLNRFDGRTTRSVQIPPGIETSTDGYVAAMTTLEDIVYLAVVDSYSAVSNDYSYGRVMAFNPATEQFGQVGQAFIRNGTGTVNANGPVSIAAYAGRIYVGVAGDTIGGAGTSQNVGKIYSIDPSQTSWSLENTGTNTQGPVLSFSTFLGVLYAGTGSNYVSGPSSTALRGVVLKRDNSAGTWSVVETGTGTAGITTPGEQSVYAPMGVASGKLWAAYYFAAGGESHALIRSTADGTTWGTEVDLHTLTGEYLTLQNATVLGGIAYAVGTGSLSAYILARSAGGTWTIARNESATVGALGGRTGGIGLMKP